MEFEPCDIYTYRDTFFSFFFSLNLIWVMRWGSSPEVLRTLKLVITTFSWAVCAENVGAGNS